MGRTAPVGDEQRLLSGAMAQGAGLAVEFLAGRGFHHAIHSKYVGTYFVIIWNCVNHQLPHG
jgi:hypothetical protein